jgi:hypothetical protein
MKLTGSSEAQTMSQSLAQRPSGEHTFCCWVRMVLGRWDWIWTQTFISGQSLDQISCGTHKNDYPVTPNFMPNTPTMMYTTHALALALALLSLATLILAKATRRSKTLAPKVGIAWTTPRPFLLKGPALCSARYDLAAASLVDG